MRSKTPLVLMEQLVMVLVFALSAAFCLQIFVLSDRLSRRNDAVSEAALAAQNAAEVLKNCGGTLEAALAEETWTEAGGSWYRFYDESWKEIVYPGNKNTDGSAEPDGFRNMVSDNWSYYVEVREDISDVPGLVRAHISVTGKELGEGRSDELLFEIPVAWQEVGDDEK